MAERVTMFNSQKINTDPEPYEVYVDHRATGVRARLDDEVTAGFDCDLDLVLNPRPEYDNNPNPLLVAFRETSKHSSPEVTLIQAKVRIKVLEITWEDHERGYLILTKWSLGHLDHARKVLTRLVNIYGEKS